MSGNVTAGGNVTGADCLAGTVSLMSHVHNVQKVTAGNATIPSDPPTP